MKRGEVCLEVVMAVVATEVVMVLAVLGVRAALDRVGQAQEAVQVRDTRALDLGQPPEDR